MERPGLAILLCLVGVLLFTQPAHAFGAGNIASVSRIEGINWRHGDIEDVLKTIACVKGYKWTSMMVRRVYFGNFLRDYSQAVDVGALKGVQAEAIRLLVWILSFMQFGYATGEFEVTADRLGCYRPEEHIDNPEDYADNIDARQYDQRLRPPVRPEELAVDPATGMKNYIANERGDWATSAGYVRFSFARSIHFGRVFTSGAQGKGRQDDLYEAMRCLGQGLHCMEDFSAHSNYCELVLRELGHRNVFCHTGSATEIDLYGKRTFPIVTGTFGGVDFLHSVIGEATDHVTQSEVDEATKAMEDAASANRSSGAANLTSVLAHVPGTRDLCREAEDLQRDSENQAVRNEKMGGSSNFAPPPGSNYPGPPPDDFGNQGQGHGFPPPPPGGAPGGPNYQSYDQGFPPPPPVHPNQGGQNPSFPPPPSSSSNVDQAIHNAQQQGVSSQSSFPLPPNSDAGAQASQSQNQNSDENPAQKLDIQATIKKVYPILAFRDRVMKSIAEIVEKIPGLETLIETISERITLFIMGLLAPYVVPILKGVTKQLKFGSSTVVDASAKHQFGPWNDPHCTAPTHSLLSKDHFSNILNEPAGKVAATVLQYVAPRIIFAWENPGVPVDQVLDDIVRAFHHPAMRDPRCELHGQMFSAVQRWAENRRGGGAELDRLLSSESVKAGKNHQGGVDSGHSHGAGGAGTGGFASLGSFSALGSGSGAGSSGIPGLGNLSGLGSKIFGSSRMAGTRDLQGEDDGGGLAYGGGAPSAFVGHDQGTQEASFYGHEPTDQHYHHQEAPQYHHYGAYEQQPQEQSGQGGYDPYGTGYQQPQQQHQQQQYGGQGDPYGYGGRY